MSEPEMIEPEYEIVAQQVVDAMPGSPIGKALIRRTEIIAERDNEIARLRDQLAVISAERDQLAGAPKVTIVDASLKMAADLDEPRLWCFTFGAGHRLYIVPAGSCLVIGCGEGISAYGYYVRIFGTWESARHEMYRLFGNVWSSQNDELPDVPGYEWTDISVILGAP